MIRFSVKYILAASLLFSLVSCQVRRKDAIADESYQQLQKALHDSTSVQLIDSVYDFGTRMEGDKVSYNFRFRNTGTKPLVVEHVSASCGCTTPEKPEKPILPGQTGEIKVVFDSKGRSGKQEKHISVNANVQNGFPDMLLKGIIETNVKN